MTPPANDAPRVDGHRTPAEADGLEAMARRYARRGEPTTASRYAMTRPDVLLGVQQRERALRRLFVDLGWHDDLPTRRVLEVGCGAGGNLLELLRFGFAPEALVGVELLPERLAQARHRLPAAVTLLGGDATRLPLPDAAFDVVLQSTVFTSLLDAATRRALADRMWACVAPGGGVLWYDFTVDNPRNRDVRGVPRREADALFPHAVERRWQRLTLAPPIARRLGATAPWAYPLLAALPPLRTHALGWFGKAASGG